MKSFKIPLFGVFGLQIIVVVAAFTAVISVLSVRQERELQNALFKQLELQQGLAMTEIVAPFREKERQLELLIQLYTKEQVPYTSKIDPPSEDFPPYVVPNASSTFIDTASFANTFFPMIKRNPSISMIILGNQTDVRSASNPNSFAWDLFVLEKNVLGLVSQERVKVCLGSFPASETCGTQLELGLDTATIFGPDTGGDHFWTRPLIVTNPVTQRIQQTLAYRTRLNEDGIPSASRPASGPFLYPWRPNRGIILSVETTHVQPTIAASNPTDASVTALFTVDPRSDQDRNIMYFVAGGGNIGFPETIRPPTGAAEEAFTNSWEGGKTPNAVLNALYHRARSICYAGAAAELASPANPCENARVFDLKSGSNRYTASSIRVVDSRTRFDWMLLQYTPRKEFFGPSDESRIVGIVIGVLGAFVVVVTCVLMWFAVNSPLRALRVNMGLAAVMRNDEVKEQTPILSEITDLIAAFVQMNTKLLRARPFLPQSLLVAEDLVSHEDDEDDEEDAIDNKKLHNNKNGVDFSENEASTNVEMLSNRLGASVSLNTMMMPASTHLSPHANNNSGVMMTPQNNNTSNNYEPSSSTHTDASGPRNNNNNVIGSKAAGSPSSTMVTGKIEYRRVGILSINVCGFQTASSGLATAQQVSRMQTTLTRLIELSVGDERGIVDYFHGDRFVCGFNTARMCANVGGAAGQAAVRISDRLRADPRLSSILPQGFAMGLSTGRAMVGNHGSDTMQRLGTMGYVYTEAMRLQDYMSRHVMMNKHKNNNYVHLQTQQQQERQIRRLHSLVSQVESSNVSGSNTHFSPTTNNANPQLNPQLLQNQTQNDEDGATTPRLTQIPTFQMKSLLAGRCLVMGRTLQDVETMLFFQIIGAIPAAELMPSGDVSDTNRCVAFARSKNNAAYRVCCSNSNGVSTNNKGNETYNATFKQNLNNNNTTSEGKDSGVSPSAPVVVPPPPAHVIVGVLTQLEKPKGAEGGGNDEWLYTLEDASKGNPSAASNAAICNLWVNGFSAEEAKVAAETTNIGVLDNVNTKIMNNGGVMEFTESFNGAGSRIQAMRPFSSLALYSSLDERNAAANNNTTTPLALSTNLRNNNAPVSPKTNAVNLGGSLVVSLRQSALAMWVQHVQRAFATGDADKCFNIFSY